MSVRLRLILLNAIVLSAVLIGAIYALAITTRTIMMRNVDHDLRERAQGFRRGLPPEFRNRPGGGPDDGRFQNPPGGPGRRGPQNRPNFYDLTGKPGVATTRSKPIDPDGFARAAHGLITVSTVVVDGERIEVASGPVMDDGHGFGRGGQGGQPGQGGQGGQGGDGGDDPGAPGQSKSQVGVVQIERPLSDLDDVIVTQGQAALMLVPIALTLSVVAGWFLTSRALKPIQDMTDAASRITGQDLGTRLNVRGKDELARLASTFNGMLERLESAFQRQRQFTDDASHELRTPIARIKLTASSTLSQDSTPEEMHDALVVVDRAADAMNRLVQQLLFLARSDAPSETLDHAPVTMRSLADRLTDSYAQVASPKVVVKIEGDATVLGSLDDLVRATSNLIDNARRFSPSDGVVIVTIVTLGESTFISVVDSGPGVPDEHLAHLGERFYRVDAARSRKDGGTGLGLAIVRAIVEAHGGRMRYTNEPGGGLRAEAILPTQTTPSE